MPNKWSWHPQISRLSYGPDGWHRTYLNPFRKLFRMFYDLCEIERTTNSLSWVDIGNCFCRYYFSYLNEDVNLEWGISDRLKTAPIFQHFFPWPPKNLDSSPISAVIFRWEFIEIFISHIGLHLKRFIHLYSGISYKNGKIDMKSFIKSHQKLRPYQIEP